VKSLAERKSKKTVNAMKLTRKIATNAHPRLSLLIANPNGRDMETVSTPEPRLTVTPERLAYSVQEAADLLGVNYFSVYRLIQRDKLKVCRALRGKLLVPRSELLKLLKPE
jgi:excisionase family DNA binding protein